MWLTADGGQTWSAHEPALPALWFVTTVGASDAWALTACDHSGLPTGCTVWASHDAGATWAKVGEGRFSGMSFTDARHGWAVSADGALAAGPTSSGVFRTSDGGQTWSALAGSPCATIGWPVAVSFVSSTHGWIGCRGEEGAGQGEKGVVETSDDGRSWSTRSAARFDGSQVGTIAGSDYLIGLSMRASGVGIAWEGRGGTMRSVDGGRTWLPIPPGGTDAGPIPYGAWAATDHDWFVVMWDGNLQATTLWASHDAGKEWRSVSAVPPAQ
ncbi:MAG: hypothetical protein HY263_04175 [Chloroflexi bacterium]|nr:hypothetical protein [Chloroflexota bacterium]